MKIQKSTLPKFEISIFEKFGFGKMRNRDIKIWNSIPILKFWAMKIKFLIFKQFGFPQNKKSGPQNLKFDFDFEFLGSEFDFENLKIGFSNPSRISFRDIQIWNRHARKPPNLDFRFKILIFLRPKSWFCIRFSYHHQSKTHQKPRPRVPAGLEYRLQKFNRKKKNEISNLHISQRSLKS